MKEEEGGKYRARPHEASRISYEVRAHDSYSSDDTTGNHIGTTEIATFYINPSSDNLEFP